MGLEPGEPGGELGVYTWLLGGVGLRPKVLGSGRLPAVLQLADLGSLPAQPLGELLTGEPASGAREAEFAQSRPQRRPCLLVDGAVPAPPMWCGDSAMHRAYMGVWAYGGHGGP